MKLNKPQRENLSKAIFDVGKLVIAIIILGPLVSKIEIIIKLGLSLSGITITVLLFSWATRLLEGEE